MSTDAQSRGRIGGLTRAATAPTPQSITQAARDATTQKFRDQVRAILPELGAAADGGDAAASADIDRRAELLRRADMVRLSAKATEARQLKARIRQLEAALAAGGVNEDG
jgi:hypothetical protein